MRFLELDHAGVLSKLMDRAVDSHKGNYGRVLMLCGSVGYTGAAALAAMGALRTGAGLVYLGVPRSIYQIEAVKLTEAIVFPLPDEQGMYSEAAIPQILQRLPNMDAVLIGPGMGVSEGTEAVVKTVLEQFSGPVILDADGINVIGAHKDILRRRSSPVILTPHQGEFEHFTGCRISDRVQAATGLAGELGVIVLLKGHHTLITDGERCYRNLTGNPGMATGGSGDVLSGVIASLLGQGILPLEAAACGAWLHGAAGDICAEQIGQYGMLPNDMLNVLPRLLK